MYESRLVNCILACAVSPEHRQAVLGDLIEEFEIRREQTSRRAATIWYWTQVARSIPWLLWVPIQRNGWLQTSGVAVAACLAQAAIELAIATVMVLGALPALTLILLSLVAVSGLANLYRPGAGTLVFAVTLISVLARGVPAGFPHLLLAMSTPSASFAGAALALNTHRFAKPE